MDIRSWNSEERLHHDLGVFSSLRGYFTWGRRIDTPLLHSLVGMVPRPPADVPGPAMTLDDTTPMGSSTALNFIKPKRDRMKVHPAASVNKCSTNAPPDATPLAERINANKPHTPATLQSPLHVPGTYGHATHHAFHHGARGRNSILLADDIRPGTPERTRLGSSFRSIERLRLDATNLQRARSPMLPPPVPATRQPRSADAIDSIINREVPHDVGTMTLTEDSCEQILPEREEQNEEQNVSRISRSDRIYTLDSLPAGEWVHSWREVTNDRV